METTETQILVKANRIAAYLCAVIFVSSLSVALKTDSVVLLLDSAG